MFANFLTTIFYLKTFGLALPEPLILLIVGALLIVAPVVARRAFNRAEIVPPQDFNQNVHETLSGQRG